MRGGDGLTVRDQPPEGSEPPRGRPPPAVQPPPQSAPDQAGPAQETTAGERLRRRLRWRHVRLAISVALLGAAIGFLVDRAQDFSAAGDLLARVHPAWIAAAIAVEAASLVVFARLQRWLLRAGGVRLSLRTMVEITLAGNAMAATLPGGVAWAAAWVFGQLSRRGVDRFLRIWVFLVAGALSSFALFLVVAVGIEIAGDSGPLSDLRWPAFALAMIPVVGLGAFGATRLPAGRVVARRLKARLQRHPEGSGRLAGHVRELVARVEAVRLSPLAWAEALGLALLNWILDCAVLVGCLVALDITVPWRGIFVIYGLTQIAAVVPITPGGAGVVEGSLAALLTAYGVGTEPALATVILYRLVSFWGLVPVGWAFWVGLDFWGRTGRSAGRAHPWAFHHHGPAVAAVDDGDRRPWALLPHPEPCRDCDRADDSAQPADESAQPADAP